MNIHIVSGPYFIRTWKNATGNTAPISPLKIINEFPIVGVYQFREDIRK
ncbi:Uncharacterised protein [Klebsiella pneumoniae]|nr:Uncharacterised protein [Klebsiella pneumoniae]